MTINYLPHVADIRMKIENDSLQGLFREALLGMNTIVKEKACKDGADGNPVQLELEASDVTCLLVDFLSEVLSLTYTRKIMYCKVEFNAFSATQLKAQLYGKPIDTFDEEIKAVTYHEAEIILNAKNKYETMIVFDI